MDASPKKFVPLFPREANAKITMFITWFVRRIPTRCGQVVGALACPQDWLAQLNSQCKDAIRFVFKLTRSRRNICQATHVSATIMTTNTKSNLQWQLMPSDKEKKNCKTRSYCLSHGLLKIIFNMPPLLPSHNSLPLQKAGMFQVALTGSTVV